MSNLIMPLIALVVLGCVIYEIYHIITDESDSKIKQSK